MSHAENISASAAKAKLIDGNSLYPALSNSIGDTSAKIRLHTTEHGQIPYAVVITCSDSRVIPEAAFHAGIGELFVIRVAGNVIGDSQLASVEYAVEHLGCNLVVVLGHTNCGAVGAALSGPQSGFVRFLTDEISKAIGSEKNPLKASWLNVDHAVSYLKEKFAAETYSKVEFTGAMYHIDTGIVDFK